MNKVTSITAILKHNEPRVDSRLIAKGLGIQHKNIMELIQGYQSHLEALGVVPFQTEKPPKGSKGGRPQNFALMNEDQSYFLVTLSNNTEQTVKLKLALVMAFKVAREAIDAKTDYLPCYRECHDAVANLVKLSGSTTPESIHHMNVEKLINKAFGIPSGVRSKLPPAVRAAVSLAEQIAGVQYQRAINANEDHKAAYQAAKVAVSQYANTVRDALPLLDKGEAA